MSLQLEQCNVLIGPSGGGKSCFIGSLKLMNELVKIQLQQFIHDTGGVDQVLHFGRKTSNSININLEFDNSSYTTILVPKRNKSIQIEKETINTNRLSKLPEESKIVAQKRPKSKMESNINFRNPNLSPAIEQISNWRFYNFHQIQHATTITQRYFTETHLRPKCDNIASILHLLYRQERNAYEQIIDGIRIFLPEFDNFVFKLVPGGHIHLAWQPKGKPDCLDASTLSDGTFRFFCLATILLNPYQPTMLLLDGPELGLEPHAIRFVAEMLKIASTRTQIIVATQSLILANEFTCKEVVVVDKRDDESRYRRFENDKKLETWLGNYNNGDTWRLS